MDCRAESFANSQQSDRINRAAQSRVVGVMIVVNWDPSQDGLLGRYVTPSYVSGISPVAALTTNKTPASQVKLNPSQLSGIGVKVTGQYLTTFFTFSVREIMTLSTSFMCLSPKMWRSGDNRENPGSFCDQLSNRMNSYQSSSRDKHLLLSKNTNYALNLGDPFKVVKFAGIYTI